MVPGALAGFELGRASGNAPFVAGFVPPTPPFSTPMTLMAWFDGADASTVVTDGSGRALSWRDKATGLYATSVAGHRPAYPNYVNGLNAMYFPANEPNYLEANWLAPFVEGNTESWAVFYVIQTGDLSNYRFALSTLGNGGFFTGFSPGGHYNERTCPDAAEYTTYGGGGGVNCVCDYWDGIAQGLVKRVGGVSRVANLGGGTMGTQQYCWIGGDARAPFDGDNRYSFANIAEIVVTRYAPGIDVGNVESYLMNKWGAVNV